MGRATFAHEQQIDLPQVLSTFAPAYLAAKLPRRNPFERNGTESCSQRADAFAIAPNLVGSRNHPSAAIAKGDDPL